MELRKRIGVAMVGVSVGVTTATWAQASTTKEPALDNNTARVQARIDERAALQTDVFVARSAPAAKTPSAPSAPSAQEIAARFVSDVKDDSRLHHDVSGNDVGRLLDGMPRQVQEFFSPDRAAFGYVNDPRLLSTRDAEGNAIVLTPRMDNVWDKTSRVYGLVWTRGGEAVPVEGTMENRFFGRTAAVSLEVAGPAVPMRDGDALAAALRALR